MTSTAFDDQFAVCTPEEEEFFREKQAQQDDAFISKQCAQRAEDAAIAAMYLELTDNELSGDEMDEQEVVGYCSGIYAAIRDGKVPGVVLGGEHD